MSNILNHNRNIFDFKLDLSNYWDFHICLDQYGVNGNANLNHSKCEVVNIDFNNPDCVWFDTIYSDFKNTWGDAINNGITLNSIGYTGVDNGLIKYEKDKITNKEFLNLFVNSSYSINANDNRLKMNKVNGNNQLFDYTNDLIYDNDNQVIKLNGGFYQGFFKSDENYQVLPITIDTPWTISIELKKEDFENDRFTLNKKHPENKGMFFYIGTRAENKWFKYYTVDKGIEKNNDYFEGDYPQKETNVNESYLDPSKLVNNDKYFADDYIAEKQCEIAAYNEDDYFEEDIILNKSTELKTAEGYDVSQPNIVEIKTDNKFITYNHGKDGLTIKDDTSNIETIIYDIKAVGMENYFTLFNHTCNGYTTKNIQSLIDKKSKQYDILKDLYRNALGFQIKDDGSIGYKYLTQDCDNKSYKIESEFSYSGIINNEWCKIDIKIIPLYNNMRIMIYVNHKIVLVSKELPILNLRQLDDLYSKQEGVPFNISLGGGTQGLCDMVDLDYMTPPESILPLEKEFGGSFIGLIKNFKISICG